MSQRTLSESKHSGDWQSDDWVTAKVVAPADAKRFINRLEFLGFDYKVETDNREVRIFVRGDRLNETLDWFTELSHPQHGID